MTKINCDMGESFGIYNAGNDEQIMPLIDDGQEIDPFVSTCIVNLSYLSMKVKEFESDKTVSTLTSKM